MALLSLGLGCSLGYRKSIPASAKFIQSSNGAKEGTLHTALSDERRDDWLCPVDPLTVRGASAAASSQRTSDGQSSLLLRRTFGIPSVMHC